MYRLKNMYRNPRFWTASAIPFFAFLWAAPRINNLKEFMNKPVPPEEPNWQ
jgi:hypothetical protein